MNPDLTLTDWVLALAPLVVLGGLIVVLIWRTMRYWRGHTELQKRQTAALERIADALEKRQ
jgi:cytochrome c-type biogenesis protein CcmH/NrfF